MVVYLRDHFFDVCSACAHLLLHQHFIQFGCLYHSRSIRVDSLELSSQILHFILGRRLYKQVHRCLLEGRHTLEAAEALQDRRINLCFASGCPTLRVQFEPRVLEGLLATKTLLWVPVQKLRNEVLALRRHRREFNVIEVEFDGFDLTEHLRVRGTLEGQVAADQSVEEDTEGPHVCLGRVITLEHLRRHVVGSSSHGRHLLLLRHFGEAEVDESHRVLISDHDVVGLDISVHDVHGVTVVDRLEELLHVVSRLLLSESLVLLLCDLFKQLRSRHILHDEVHVLGVIVGFVILDNVGVVEGVEDGNLFHDVVDFVAQLHFVQHLDRHLEVRIVLVVRLEDAAKCPDSEHFGL